MTGQSTAKGLWGVVSLSLALIVALFTAVAEGYLWQGANSRANLKTADATMVASNAATVASDAAQKEAANRLQAAIEQANAVIASANAQASAIVNAANVTAQAQRVAARDQADAVVAASKEVSRAQNAEYDQITKRFIGDPVEKADQLNNQIVRLQNEIESGRDSATGRPLSREEAVNRQRKLESLQMEHKIQAEITAKNWKDAMEMVTGATGGLLGGLGGLYPSQADRIPADRRLRRFTEPEP